MVSQGTLMTFEIPSDETSYLSERLSVHIKYCFWPRNGQLIYDWDMLYLAIMAVTWGFLFLEEL